MAEPINSDWRRSYSWWWDSHISPTNSNEWLRRNLTHMDAKIEEMFKIVDPDADSFAKRADMYYRKRPELMKLIEDFYRAYRALAERYNKEPNQAAIRAETEVEILKRALANMQTDKEAIQLNYMNTMKRLSDLEEERISCAQKNSVLLDELAKKAETEVQSLKEELLVKKAETEAQKRKNQLLEAVRDDYLEKISKLRSLLCQANETSKGLNARAIQEETKNTHLETELSRLEKESGCFKENVNRAENDLRNLKLDFAELNKEKDVAALQNMEKIRKLEASNQSLQLEVDDLMKKVSMKGQELLKDLEKLQNEQFRFVQVETTLKTMQNSHSQSQKDNKAMDLELKKSLQMLEDLFFHLGDKPLIIQGGTRSFSMDKQSGRKCYMLAARDLYIVWSGSPEYWRFKSLPESRFPEVAELISVCWLEINGKISRKMLSPNTLYGAYLVFKLTSESYGFQNQAMEISCGISGGSVSETQTVFLDHRDIGSSSIVGKYKPEKRRDWWLEIKLGEYFSLNGEDDQGDLHMSLKEVKILFWKRGLIVEGIEIRPESQQKF